MADGSINLGLGAGGVVETLSVAVGVGEGPDDLQPFAADEFAKALAGVGVD